MTPEEAAGLARLSYAAFGRRLFRSEIDPDLAALEVLSYALEDETGDARIVLVMRFARHPGRRLGWRFSAHPDAYNPAHAVSDAEAVEVWANVASAILIEDLLTAEPVDDDEGVGWLDLGGRPPQ